MKLANLADRAVLVAADGKGIDVEQASDGRFGPDVAPLYARWEEFAAWVAEQDLSAGTLDIDPARLGAPSPRPQQILAFGLNYSEHAAESGFEAPEALPPVFPKFVSALSGPVTEVVLPEGGTTDWEVEIVAVIGAPVTGPISPEEGWNHVAGLTVGNDVSDRAAQFSTPAAQFGLGKSYPGFAPTGPWLVTPDELEREGKDKDDLHLTCSIDGEIMQDGRSANMLISVPGLVAGLSEVVQLYPGDLIFTGTPEGVGLGRDPKVFIEPGQEMVTRVEGIGELRQRFVATSTQGKRTPKTLKSSTD